MSKGDLIGNFKALPEGFSLICLLDGDGRREVMDYGAIKNLEQTFHDDGDDMLRVRIEFTIPRLGKQWNSFVKKDEEPDEDTV